MEYVLRFKAADERNATKDITALLKEVRTKMIDDLLTTEQKAKLAKQ